MNIFSTAFSGAIPEEMSGKFRTYSGENFSPELSFLRFFQKPDISSGKRACSGKNRRSPELSFLRFFQKADISHEKTYGKSGCYGFFPEEIFFRSMPGPCLSKYFHVYSNIKRQKKIIGEDHFPDEMSGSFRAHSGGNFSSKWSFSHRDFLVAKKVSAIVITGKKTRYWFQIFFRWRIYPKGRKMVDLRSFYLAPS